LAKRWGAFVREVELPPVFGYALDWHRSIMEPDIAKSFENEYEQGRARISTVLREMIERGRKVAAVDYSRALDGALALRRELDRLFDEYDVILTPATPGAAPMGLDATGSPMFCTLWTLVGVPAISVPILRGEEGMPMGAQLVGRKGDDAGLLRAARWLVEFESGERAS
jgi:Asp-tRNA(Asn)/Glu-tRNA(Gln) amidotransferase A subunit family amidase